MCVCVCECGVCELLCVEYEYDVRLCVILYVLLSACCAWSIGEDLRVCACVSVSVFSVDIVWKGMFVRFGFGLRDL